MKLTKDQANWMEDTLVFSALLLQADGLKELVEGLAIKEVEDSYNKFMDLLDEHQERIRSQLEIVEDDK